MPAGFGENYSSHVHRRRDEKLYLDPICNASRFEKVVPGFYGYRYRELGIITDTDPNTGINRSSPIFRYSSEFRYSSRSLHIHIAPWKMFKFFGGS